MEIRTIGGVAVYSDDGDDLDRTTKNALLEGISLQKAILPPGVNLWEMKMPPKANLSSAICIMTTFSRAEMREAILAGIRLLQSKMNSTILPNSDLSHAQMIDTDFENVHAEGADLTGAVFVGSRVNGSDFSDATLVKAQFIDVKGVKAIFCGANLTGARLSGDFTGADFREAVLVDCVIAGSLKDAKFQDAKMVRTDFSNAIFEKTDGINHEMVTPFDVLKQQKTIRLFYGHPKKKLTPEDLAPPPSTTEHGPGIRTEFLAEGIEEIIKKEHEELEEKERKRREEIDRIKAQPDRLNRGRNYKSIDPPAMVCSLSKLLLSGVEYEAIYRVECPRRAVTVPIGSTTTAFTTEMKVVGEIKI